LPLTRWQKLSIKIKIRYKIKREIFTVGIPLAIAAVFVFYAFYTGYASIAPPTTLSSAAESQSALKEAEYQAIVANQSGAASGNSSALNNLAPPKPVSNAPEKQNLYLVVVVGPIVALSPYTADIFRDDRRKRQYEQDFADFLFELSELVRGGIDPAKAYLTLAKGEVGSITRFVQISARQMAIGFTFEQALHNLGDSIESDLAKRYIDLVIQASYSGGSVSNLIQQAAIDMGNFLTIDKEKRSGLSQYTVILYTGQVVLVVLAAIMVVQFVPQLSEITQIGSAGLSGFLGQSDIGNVTIERDLFFLITINGMFGGLIIGKISEGRIKHGIKHALILMLIGLIVWDAYVLPAVNGPAQNVTVAVVSYDKTGLASFPTQDPLVVNVTNSQGQAVDNAQVTFAIGGGGTITPATINTDVAGQATVKVTLGPTAGPDAIVITSGNSQVSISITAVSGQG
jgi:archaeal flagellar protein FlaJ